MSAWMTSEQRYGWQVALDLRLRRASGVAFQDFFADVMIRAHGDDYVPTRPRGTLGDKGCDGYLASSGRVFACYGKQDDASPRVPDILEKMDDDYAKACLNLKDALREWCFVHNMLDGTPTDVTVVKLGEMRTANPKHVFTVMGRAGFEERIFAMQEGDIISLIGMAASAEDTRNMRMEVVADLVNGIIAAVEEAPFDAAGDPKPVPAEKLHFNGLPMHWRHTIKAQMPNAKLVEQYLSRHRDVTLGSRIATLFKTRYGGLKEQELQPGAIMTKLYEGLVGIGTVTNDRAVAAQAVLAFLFDACDIFEDRPVELPIEGVA